ncbi:fungal-specific transcription factor domain-containing protein [Xylariomycetidae sp. FL0641]|nr:fungal-specific transcription factor domain-containing protein [Xylariomycetidae sp. FL0641]
MIKECRLVMSPTEGDGDSTTSPRPAKRPRRSYVACNRCHTQKTKCTGEKPCRGCLRSGNAAECTYPNRERKVTVLESYIEKLETENAELKKAAPSAGGVVTLASPAVTEQPALALNSTAGDDTGEEDEATAEVANPLIEDRLSTEHNGVSARPVYVGGAACTAFATRLGANASESEVSRRPHIVPMVKHPTLLRAINSPYTLPNRAYAQVLVQVVLRFVGHDYHLLRKKSYFEKIDEIYDDPDSADRLSLCRLFVTLALGELYLKRTGSSEGGERKVPGTQFFLRAVALFEERYEEPEVDYIETLLLLSFYSHALNRKNTAYTYAGLALRLSVTLGLHRNITYRPNVSAAEIENRRRVWWTVYTFDRLCSSKLGHAVMIKDEDIDTPLPSTEGMAPEEADDFLDPKQLIANIKLSRITGSILTLIYGATTPRPRDFVRNVHTILNNLKLWEAGLPSELKLDHNRFPSYGSRSVASLRLHFNQCIILTTRPVLLHVFNYHVQHGQVSSPSQSTKPLSPMTVALSEACIYAARASANLLGQLWADGNIAQFGYFDAHYLFSSTVVLMMSDALRTNDADNDAITLSGALLQSMVDDGNLPAREFHDRLGGLRQDVGKLKAAVAALRASPMRGYVTSTGTFAANVSRDPRADVRLDLPAAAVKSEPLGFVNPPTRPPSSAPLDAPFLQDFLGNLEQSWGPGVLDTPSNEFSEWTLALDNTDFL